MNNLTYPWNIGTLRIKNRLVRSATVEGLSTEDGKPTEKLIDIYTDLAKGGVGLIIAGTAYISKEGQGDRNSTGLHCDTCIEPLSRLCNAVHDAGGVLAAQLLHSGSTLNPTLICDNKKLFGPSAMNDPVSGYPVEELSKDHILQIIEDYVKASLRAKEAGFKAVQIHAGHGYLINQFLSPSRNNRSDEYGGSVKNRSLLLCQIYEGMRGHLGKHYPIFIKLSAHDGFQGGIEPVDAVQIASILDDLGIDAIEITAGTPEGAMKGGWDHIIPAPIEEGALLKYALQIKDKVSCPVISVEGWRDPYKIVKALEKIDAVSMSRPFIREPNLSNRWLSGDLSPALCISCNRCLDLLMASGLGCVFQKPLQP